MSDIYQKYEEFKNFEIVFKGHDGEIHKVKGKVHAIESSNITVYASIKNNKFVDIQEGSRVNVYVYTENGIYYSNAKVLFVEKDNTQMIYTLTYPINSKHLQRREFFRADMTLPVTVKIVKDILTGISETWHVRSRDVCGNGVSFVSDKEIKTYEGIFLTLEFPDKVIETAAKLVYTREKEVRGKTYYINALTFTSISPRNIDFIVKKCFLYQLRLKNME